MHFHFGVEETVLFDVWKITCIKGMINSAAAIFLTGLLYEGIKYFRQYLFRNSASAVQLTTVRNAGEDNRIVRVQRTERYCIFSWQHALQTVLQVIQTVISYCLMLIFMTFNVWLCTAVVLGIGFGYFLFGWKNYVVDSEHCQ